MRRILICMIFTVNGMDLPASRANTESATHQRETFVNLEVRIERATRRIMDFGDSERGRAGDLERITNDNIVAHLSSASTQDAEYAMTYAESRRDCTSLGIALFELRIKTILEKLAIHDDIQTATAEADSDLEKVETVITKILQDIIGGSRSIDGLGHRLGVYGVDNVDRFGGRGPTLLPGMW